MKSGFSHLCLSLGVVCSLAFLTNGTKEEHLAKHMEDLLHFQKGLQETLCFTSEAKITLQVESPDGKMPFLNYNSLDEEEKKKELKDALFRLCHAISVKPEEGLTEVSKALTYFNAFLKGFKQSGIEKPVDHILVKQGKFKSSLFTKAMNRFARMEHQMMINSTIKDHAKLLAEMFALIIPKEVDGFLFKVMVTALIMFSKEREDLYSFEFICNRYLKQVTNVKVNLFDIVGFKPTYDPSDPLKSTSSSIFDTNFYFFVSDIESKILSSGTFYDVENYVSREIFPIQVRNGYGTVESRTTNRILMKLLMNKNLNSGEKVHFIIRIIEQADMNLPCTYYFSEYDCGEAKNKLKEFINHFNEARADDRARMAWNNFSSTIFNNRDKEEYAMQKLIEQQQTRMIAYHHYQPYACKSPSTIYLLDRLESPHSIDDENKSDINAKFCNVIKNCYDLSLEYKNDILLTMAGIYCATTDINIEAIDNAIAKSYLGEDAEKYPHILEAVVDYCIFNSVEQGKLLPACAILLTLHNEKDKFNLFSYWMVRLMMKKHSLRLILDLGLSMEKFDFTIHKPPLQKILKGTEDIVFNKETLLNNVFKALVDGNIGGFEFYLKALVETKKPPDFERRYHSFIQAATLQEAIVSAGNHEESNKGILETILHPFFERSKLTARERAGIVVDYGELHAREKKLRSYSYYKEKFKKRDYDFSDFPKYRSRREFV